MLRFALLLFPAAGNPAITDSDVKQTKVHLGKDPNTRIICVQESAAPSQYIRGLKSMVKVPGQDIHLAGFKIGAGGNSSRLR